MIHRPVERRQYIVLRRVIQINTLSIVALGVNIVAITLLREHILNNWAYAIFGYFLYYYYHTFRSDAQSIIATIVRNLRNDPTHSQG